jgi:hypothetical protein
LFYQGQVKKKEETFPAPHAGNGSKKSN